MLRQEIKKEIITEQYLVPDMGTSQAGGVRVGGFTDSLLERLVADPRLEALITPRRRARVFQEGVPSWTELVECKICSKSGKNEVGRGKRGSDFGVPCVLQEGIWWFLFFF